MFQLNPLAPVGKRTSSAMEGKLLAMDVTWIPTIPTGMTRPPCFVVPLNSYISFS